MSEPDKNLDSSDLLLLVSLSCAVERRVGDRVATLSDDQWRGFICGLPDDWEALIQARSDALLPGHTRWADSGVIGMLSLPEEAGPLSPTLPLFVAAPDLGVMYWPIEAVSFLPPGLDRAGEDEALEALRKEMAARVAWILEAGRCESPMSVGPYPGSGFREWQAEAPAAVARWRALSLDRSLGEGAGSPSALSARRAL